MPATRTTSTTSRTRTGARGGRGTGRGARSSRSGPRPPPRRGGRGRGPAAGGGEYRKVFKGAFGSYNEHPANENDNWMALLCYIFGILPSIIILLVVKPMSPWLRFHIFQALFMWIGAVLFWGVISVISIPLFIILVGFLCMSVAQLLLLLFWVYMIIIGVMCATWKDHRVPYLADWVEKTFV